MRPLGRAWVMLVASLRMGFMPLWQRPRQLPHPFIHVMIQQEDPPVWPRKWVLTRHRVYWCLDLRLPSFQSCEKWVCAVFKPPKLWYSILEVWTNTPRCYPISPFLLKKTSDWFLRLLYILIVKYYLHSNLCVILPQERPFPSLYLPPFRQQWNLPTQIATREDGYSRKRERKTCMSQILSF